MDKSLSSQVFGFVVCQITWVQLSNKSLVVKGRRVFWIIGLKFLRIRSHTFTTVFGTAAYHAYHSQDFHVIIGTELHIVELTHSTFYNIILSGNATCPYTSFLRLSCDHRDWILSCVAGRSWKAIELRQKSWEDLHQLWYVLLKEKNMLLSQKQMLTSQNLRMPNPERFPKVSLSYIFLHPLSLTDAVVWRSLVWRRCRNKIPSILDPCVFWKLVHFPKFLAAVCENIIRFCVSSVLVCDFCWNQVG